MVMAEEGEAEVAEDMGAAEAADMGVAEAAEEGGRNKPDAFPLQQGRRK